MSERMSPKVFSVSTTSIVSGAFTIVIAYESTSAWSSGTSGYSAPELGDDVPPEPRGVEDVDLVDRGHPPVAPACELEGAAGDALDLGREYSHVSNQVPSSRVPFSPK